jgi:hypothetical protein
MIPPACSQSSEYTASEALAKYSNHLIRLPQFMAEMI